MSAPYGPPGRHSLSYDPPNSSGGSGRTCKDKRATERGTVIDAKRRQPWNDLYSTTLASTAIALSPVGDLKFTIA